MATTTTTTVRDVLGVKQQGRVAMPHQPCEQGQAVAMHLRLPARHCGRVLAVVAEQHHLLRPSAERGQHPCLCRLCRVVDSDSGDRKGIQDRAGDGNYGAHYHVCPVQHVLAVGLVLLSIGHANMHVDTVPGAGGEGGTPGWVKQSKGHTHKANVSRTVATRRAGPRPAQGAPHAHRGPAGSSVVDRHYDWTVYTQQHLLQVCQGGSCCMHEYRW